MYKGGWILLRQSVFEKATAGNGEGNMLRMIKLRERGSDLTYLVGWNVYVGNC